MGIAEASETAPGDDVVFGFDNYDPDKTLEHCVVLLATALNNCMYTLGADVAPNLRTHCEAHGTDTLSELITISVLALVPRVILLFLAATAVDRSLMGLTIASIKPHSR